MNEENKIEKGKIEFENESERFIKSDLKTAVKHFQEVCKDLVFEKHEEPAEIKEFLIALTVKFPEAQAEIENIKGEIVAYRFDYAYGVTPSLFLDEKTAEDTFLHRIRLIDDATMERIKENINDFLVRENKTLRVELADFRTSGELATLEHFKN